MDWRGGFGWVARGIFLNPGGFSLFGWLLQTAFCLVLALVIAALMPKQLRAVQQNVGRKPWASLGWGALVFFVVAPAILIVLVISLIGLLLVLPYLLLVALTYFVVTTGASAFLAQKVITGFGGKENLMLAVTIGVVGTTIVSQIPVIGPLLMLALLVFGIGAAAIGVADWRRRRREAAAALAAAQAAVAAQQYQPAAGAASVITPMVYTAPDVPVGGTLPATAVTVPQPAVPAEPAEPPAAPAGPQAPQAPVPPAAVAPAEATGTSVRRSLRTRLVQRRPTRRPRPSRVSSPDRRHDPPRRRRVLRLPARGYLTRTTVGRAGRRGPPFVARMAAHTKGEDVTDDVEHDHREERRRSACHLRGGNDRRPARRRRPGARHRAGLRPGRRARAALAGVDIDLQRGAYTAIMGPSGSGKSTLMHILAGLDRPTAGNVWIDGQEITTLKERALTQLRRDQIGFIFQTFNLLPTLTAAENITLPLTIAGRKGDQDWVDELVKTVGLGDRLTHKPSELSGGQQQRVAVARALASRPAVLFADEPTGNLDSRTGEEVLQLLRHSRDVMGQTIVMVTHDAHAATYADRIVFLKDGAIAHDCGRLGRDDIYDVIKSLEDVVISRPSTCCRRSTRTRTSSCR